MNCISTLLGNNNTACPNPDFFTTNNQTFSSSKITNKSRRIAAFLLTALLLCFGMPQFAAAQVKIGDNPETINPNSLLELEGSNKGLLAPRVALTDASLPAPLTAPVPSGMIVYNSGSALPAGFYFWNGTKWLAVQTTESGRANYVLVKSAADLPAPVSGVITLKAGTTYEVNGTIALSNKINLNGCYLVGRDANNDRIIYSGAGELFTGNKGGTLRLLTLSSGSNAKLFELALPATENLLMRDVIVAGCKEVGQISGGYIVFFSVIQYKANTNGITYQNVNTLLLDNTAWFDDNKGTFEKLSGSFTHINKLGGFSMPMSANSATAFDISAIPTISEAGNLKNTAFLGTGVKVNGSFTKKWEVEAAGIATEKDATATASCYITTSGATGITKANTPVKIIGATTTSELVRFTAPQSNRLQYDGTKSRTFIVNAVLSLTGTSSTAYTYSFYIYKNGVQVPGSRQRTKVYSGSGDIQTVAIVCTVSLAPGDYVEVWAENNNSTDDLTAQNMTLIIK